jgi:hypothetical protein
MPPRTEKLLLCTPREADKLFCTTAVDLASGLPL